MIRRSVALVAIAAFGCAMIPAPDSIAKPRGCFTKAEQKAEEVIRYGLRLREGGRACDAAPWNAGTLPLWEAVDKQFGPQFKEQTDIRTKAFQREFESDADHNLKRWNSRIVIYYRNFTLSPVYCEIIKKDLVSTQKNGWNAFVKLAVIAHNDVRMTYQPCDL